jgi:hypothetical protein
MQKLFTKLFICFFKTLYFLFFRNFSQKFYFKNCAQNFVLDFLINFCLNFFLKIFSYIFKNNSSFFKTFFLQARSRRAFFPFIFLFMILDAKVVYKTFYLFFQNFLFFVFIEIFPKSFTLKIVLEILF